MTVPVDHTDGQSARGDDALIFLQMTRSAGNATIAILLEEFGEALYVLHTGVPYNDFRAKARDDACRVYAGHFLYGAHRHIPRPCRYFTILRHPVEQLLSRYEAMCRSAGVRLDLMTWLERDFESRNGSVKRLLGAGILPGDKILYDAVSDRPLDGEFTVGEAEYEQALETVEQHFLCVLFKERFTQSMAVLRRLIDSGPLFSTYGQFINRAEVPVKRSDYPPAVIDWIVDNNTYDLRLYARLRRIFDDHVGAQDEAFHQEVATLDVVSEMLADEQSVGMDSQQALFRLIAFVNELGRAGRRADALRVMRLFAEKTVISRDFCRAVLRFVREHGSPGDLQDEMEKYRQRFGDDEFVGAMDAGAAGP